jgi:hypothetical protein
MTAPDLPTGLRDVNCLFEIVQFLENNKVELTASFLPEVGSYRVKETFFHGPFLRSYQLAFDELIIRLIKRELLNHFPALDPEEILLVTDRAFLKTIASDYFLLSAYPPKETL